MGGRRGSCSPALFSPAETDERVNRAPRDRDAIEDLIVYKRSPDCQREDLELPQVGSDSVARRLSGMEEYES